MKYRVLFEIEAPDETTARQLLVFLEDKYLASSFTGDIVESYIKEES